MNVQLVQNPGLEILDGCWPVPPVDAVIVLPVVIESSATRVSGFLHGMLRHFWKTRRTYRTQWAWGGCFKNGLCEWPFELKTANSGSDWQRTLLAALNELLSEHQGARQGGRNSHKVVDVYR